MGPSTIHIQLLREIADHYQVVVGCASEFCKRALSLGAARALARHAHDYDAALEDTGPYEAIEDCADWVASRRARAAGASSAT